MNNHFEKSRWSTPMFFQNSALLLLLSLMDFFLPCKWHEFGISSLPPPPPTPTLDGSFPCCPRDHPSSWCAKMGGVWWWDLNYRVGDGSVVAHSWIYKSNSFITRKKNSRKLVHFTVNQFCKKSSKTDLFILYFICFEYFNFGVEGHQSTSKYNSVFLSYKDF